jgi:hypothetical protein
VAFENLPNFRKWFQRSIDPDISNSRNDMLVLGDFIKYYLAESMDVDHSIDFHVRYRDRSFYCTLAVKDTGWMNPSVYKGEIVIDLTDHSINSFITHSGWSEGVEISD